MDDQALLYMNLFQRSRLFGRNIDRHIKTISYVESSDLGFTSDSGRLFIKNKIERLKASVVRLKKWKDVADILAKKVKDGYQFTPDDYAVFDEVPY